jgi:hypothetical protein
MWKVLTLSAAAAVIAWPAAAQPQCSPRASVLKMLESKYKEAPVAVGVTNNGGLVEVLSTGQGETWSIIITTPQGVSCLVAAGEGWRAVEHVAMDPEA